MADGSNGPLAHGLPPLVGAPGVGAGRQRGAEPIGHPRAHQQVNVQGAGLTQGGAAAPEKKYDRCQPNENGNAFSR